MFGFENEVSLRRKGTVRVASEPETQPQAAKSCANGPTQIRLVPGMLVSIGCAENIFQCINVGLSSAEFRPLPNSASFSNGNIVLQADQCQRCFVHSSDETAFAIESPAVTVGVQRTKTMLSLKVPKKPSIKVDDSLLREPIEDYLPSPLTPLMSLPGFSSGSSSCQKSNKRIHFQLPMSQPSTGLCVVSNSSKESSKMVEYSSHPSIYRPHDRSETFTEVDLVVGLPISWAESLSKENTPPPPDMELTIVVPSSPTRTTKPEHRKKQSSVACHRIYSNHGKSLSGTSWTSLDSQDCLFSPRTSNAFSPGGTDVMGIVRFLSEADLFVGNPFSPPKDSDKTVQFSRKHFLDWRPKDVREWVKSLDISALHRYADRFYQQHVSGIELGRVTLRYLHNELMILNRKHRKQLLGEIQKLIQS